MQAPRQTPVSRAGHPPEFVTPPSVPPVYQTTAFDLPDLNVLGQISDGQTAGHVYTRDSNPNHTALADTLAHMERADAGMVFSSGMGAIAALIMSLAQTGDHLLVSDSLYGRTLQLLRRLKTQFRLQVTETDTTDLDQVARQIRPETIVSGGIGVQSAAVCGRHRRAGSEPRICPADCGQHIHNSATCATAGTGRPCSGAQRVQVPERTWGRDAGHGGRPATADAGRRRNSQSIRATWLQQQPAVGTVHFPLLAHHPACDLARRLYPDGTGGIVTIELAEGGEEAVSRLMRAVPELPFSPTLGDARTTLSHPASTSHRYMNDVQRAAAGISAEMIRISVGLESLEQLQEDFDRGLAAV